jgi:NAD(P)-dependent dehydrogenase (short-subunit alcohol dehydrogenase family)
LFEAVAIAEATSIAFSVAVLAQSTPSQQGGSALLQMSVHSHGATRCRRAPRQMTPLVRPNPKEVTVTHKLAGKVALVTGGSSDIGLGIAKRFADEGARVFITGRRQSELEKVVAAIGRNAATIGGDTSDLADLDRIYATIKEDPGRLDVLAVNAGIYEFGTFGEITEQHFDKTFNTNVRGLLFAVQKALPLLTRGSSVILTGSMVSIKGFAACSVYNASKAAVRSFARTWIVDLKGRDIRINVLSPGYTATPGLSHFLTEEDKASAVATVPLGRIGTPDDLGKAAVFLASGDSAYITGIELFVDGGAIQI